MSLLFSALLPLIVGTGRGQADPLNNQNLKENLAGWMVFGPAAKVALAPDAPNNPHGALKFDYKIQKGETDALIQPVPVGSLAKAQSVKFNVMSDSGSPVGVILSEEDGAHYIAICATQKGSWQPVELSTSDFILGDGPGDPPDPTGKLDLGKVNVVAVIDLNTMLVSAGNEQLETLLHVEKGPHTAYIKDFSVESKSVSSTSAETPFGANLDTFCHPQLDWFALGGVSLTLPGSSPLNGQALEWTYRQETNKLVGASLTFRKGLMAGADEISFDVASDRGGTLRVQLEETGGNKFSMNFDLPVDGKPKHVELNFSDFRSTDDSADPKAKLELSKVKTLLLMDVSGLLSQADPAHPDNHLFINHLQARVSK